MAGVTSSYPAALDSESNLTPPNNGDTLSVADHWLAGNSGPIVAIETELGTDPAGYATDVKTRLNTINPSSGLLAANGLQFPGTQSPSADANTLDDYEEGTFTPTIGSATSYGIQSGLYTKLGNIVNIQIQLLFVHSGTFFGTIGGLPFSGSSSIDYTSITWKEYYSTGWHYAGRLRSGGSVLEGIGKYDNTAGTNNGQTYGFAFSFTYRVS